MVTVTATLSYTSDAKATQETVVQFAIAGDTDKGSPPPGGVSVLTPAGTPAHHHAQHVGAQACHRHTNVMVNRSDIEMFPGDAASMAKVPLLV